MRKALTQKNTLLKNAQANAESNFFKRVFFSPTQEEFFPSLLFLIKLFRHRTGFMLNLTNNASKLNRFGVSFVLTSDSDDIRQKRRASANN